VLLVWVGVGVGIGLGNEGIVEEDWGFLGTILNFVSQPVVILRFGCSGCTVFVERARYSTEFAVACQQH
jgi:hypothetical protein